MWLTWGAALVAVAMAEGTAGARGWGGRRYALVVGNNVGRLTDRPLRFAERDAVRFASILQRYGGVEPEDSVLMLGAPTTKIRRAMLELNARIRSESRRGDSVLVVYYSGHAGADGLHPDGSVLSYDELRAMLRGSPATVRLLLLDGCRSGELTTVKGAHAVPEFAVNVDNGVGVEGLVMISSSAAGEDSHESGRLSASFFSHHLSNALLGAADDNRDGRVTLREAYAYAYTNTLRASGRTMSLQHPTFAFSLKGRGDMVLTDLRSTAAARILMPAAGIYLVFEENAEGALVAEVHIRKRGAQLAMRPGAYFIQFRERDHYLEYRVELNPRQRYRLDPARARRVEYARLVRKGDAPKRAAHAMFLSAAGRGAVIEGGTAAPGIGLTYSLALPWISVSLHARHLRHLRHSLTRALVMRQDESAVGIGLQYFGDLRWLSVGGGLVLDAVWHRQRFGGRAHARGREQWGVAFGGLLSVELSLAGPLTLRLEGGPKTYILRQATTKAGAQAAAQTRTPLTYYVSLGLGWML